MNFLKAAFLALSLLFVAPASALELQRSVTSAYTLGQSGNDDCDHRIVAAGATYYSISATGTYSTGCKVWITNNDPMPNGTNATGAKFLSFINCVPGFSGTYLFPQQSIEVVYTGSNWTPTDCPARWRIPRFGTQLTLFAINIDPVNGSDVWGAADGLAIGSRAFKTVQWGVLGIPFDYFDLAGTQMQFKCSVAGGRCDGYTDPYGLHFPIHGGFLGAQGGAGTILNCQGLSIAGTPSVSAYFSPLLPLPSGCTFATGISLDDKSQWRDGGVASGMEQNTYCAAPGGQVFVALNNSSIHLLNGANVCAQSGGDLTRVMSIANSSTFINGGTLTFLGPLSVTSTEAVIYASGESVVQLGSVSGGSNVTGRKWQLYDASSIINQANVPGTVAGSTCANCSVR